MFNNRKATYWKEVGDDRGALKLGRYWVKFDCLWCAEMFEPALFFGPRASRWQGPPSEAIQRAMASKSGHHRCKGPERHKTAARFHQALRNGAHVGADGKLYDSNKKRISLEEE